MQKNCRNCNTGGVVCTVLAAGAALLLICCLPFWALCLLAAIGALLWALCLR
ncbi:MAG TPA: hypothetical protein P5116_07775 [Eubacteriales bacterium]|nr:hypothetical protein [Clostridia bacterium]HRV73756.1 hypothetical protein [Eubacteriales bacterium]